MRKFEVHILSEFRFFSSASVFLASEANNFLYGKFDFFHIALKVIFLEYLVTEKF